MDIQIRLFVRDVFPGRKSQGPCAHFTTHKDSNWVVTIPIKSDEEYNFFAARVGHYIIWTADEKPYDINKDI